MKTFACRCGNRLFFENTQCVVCSLPVGWCPRCSRITSLLSGEGDVPDEAATKPNPRSTFRCGQPDCGAVLVRCHNYAVEEVCNRCVAVPDSAGPTAEGELHESGELPLCDSCVLTSVIPNLDVDGNRQKWYRLEAAKRRLLVQLDRLGLPYGTEVDPPLSFEFKADGGDVGKGWRPSGEDRVHTGHADGVITVNIVEADDAAREAMRVRFGEVHRTLVGHLRHEIGHYYWQMLVEGRCEPEFHRLFGDHEDPPYADALERYYEEGPAADWRDRFVSAYASMHPWEDFAETFALHLEINSVLDTAMQFGMIPGLEPRERSMRELMGFYQSIGLMANELNRSLELPDLAPRTLPPAVLPKLEFVHTLPRRTPTTGK